MLMKNTYVTADRFIAIQRPAEQEKVTEEVPASAKQGSPAIQESPSVQGFPVDTYSPRKEPLRNKVLRVLAPVAGLAGGVTAAVSAGRAVAGLLPVGPASFTGTVGAAVLGAVSGGLTGFAIAKCFESDTIRGGAHAELGNTIVVSALTLAGGAVGGIVGAGLGICGINPVPVVPAVVAAGFAGTALPVAAASPFLKE